MVVGIERVKSGGLFMSLLKIQDSSSVNQD